MLIHRMIFFHFTNRKLLVKLKTSPTLPSCKHRILKHHSKFTFIGVWPAAGEIFLGCGGSFTGKTRSWPAAGGKFLGDVGGVSTGKTRSRVHFERVFCLKQLPKSSKFSASGGGMTKFPPL